MVTSTGWQAEGGMALRGTLASTFFCVWLACSLDVALEATHPSGALVDPGPRRRGGLGLIGRPAHVVASGLVPRGGRAMQAHLWLQGAPL